PLWAVSIRLPERINKTEMITPLPSTWRRNFHRNFMHYGAPLAGAMPAHGRIPRCRGGADHDGRRALPRGLGWDEATTDVPGVAETWTGVPAGEAKPRLHFPQVAGAAASSSPACCVRVAGRHRHVAVTGKVPGGGADSSHRLAGGCGTGSMNG